MRALVTGDNFGSERFFEWPLEPIATNDEAAY